MLILLLYVVFCIYCVTGFDVNVALILLLMFIDRVVVVCYVYVVGVGYDGRYVCTGVVDYADCVVCYAVGLFGVVVVGVTTDIHTVLFARLCDDRVVMPLVVIRVRVCVRRLEHGLVLLLLLLLFALLICVTCILVLVSRSVSVYMVMLRLVLRMFVVLPVVLVLLLLFM